MGCGGFLSFIYRHAVVQEVQPQKTLASYTVRDIPHTKFPYAWLLQAQATWHNFGSSCQFHSCNAKDGIPGWWVAPRTACSSAKHFLCDYTLSGAKVLR